MTQSAPFDSPPPKPKPGEEHERFEPGNDIGPWRILLPILALAVLDIVLLASSEGQIRLPRAVQRLDTPPLFAAIVASQSLLVAMMYQGSAATMVRSLRQSLRSAVRYVVCGVAFHCGASILMVVGQNPMLGMAMAGGVFVGLTLDLLGFGLRPHEDVPALSRRFSLKSIFFCIALVASLLAGFQFTVSEIDKGNLNVFRITLAFFLTLATLGIGALASMWSWPMWLAGAAISIVAVNILTAHDDKAGATVAFVPVYALTISATNALPLVLAGWRVYRKPYYG